MPETAVYAPGVPMWIDISAKDPDKARTFYSALFGWTHDEPRKDMGDYAIFSYNGKVVAGVGQTMDDSAPTAWMQYVATEDINAIAESVKANGGEIVAGPMEVADQGSMLVFKDSTGAYCGVWQPNQMHGAELVNKPGSFTWSELNTRDIDGAHKFYEKVFNWGIKENPFETPDGPGMYTEWQVDGRSIAGGMTMASSLPAQVPANWLVYFAVDDVDATTNKVSGLGGQVAVPPMDIPQGRMAVLSDNQGAMFAIIKMAS